MGFIGKIIGGIISGILTKIIVLVAVVGGGKYLLDQNGGIPGVMAMVQGKPMPAGAASGPPITAGIGGIMASLGFGGKAADPGYYEQQGRISEITVECRLSRMADGKMTRTKPLPCDRAQVALTHAQYQGFTVNQERRATYIYYGQNGVDVLTGSMTAKRGQKVGDVIDLRVNSADPRRSTPI